MGCIYGRKSTAGKIERSYNRRKHSLSFRARVQLGGVSIFLLMDIQIRKLTTKDDEKKYKDLCKYCFENFQGWIDRIFPLGKGETAWGIDENRGLAAGLITRKFHANFLGKSTSCTGISAVASYPEKRRYGYIRTLFQKAFAEEYEKEVLLSSLYPFKTTFYEKLGYGNAKGYMLYEFDIADLRFTRSRTGRMIRFQGDEKEAEAFYRLRNTFHMRYDFSLWAFEKSAQELTAILENENQFLYQLFDKTGSSISYIRYKIDSEKDSRVIYVSDAGWKNREGFLAILNHLYMHADQCERVSWEGPPNMPIAYYIPAYSFTKKQKYHWMARPVYVKHFLKVLLDNAEEPVRMEFALRDPLIEENTCLYSISDNQVTLRDYDPGKDIPFSLFSGLVCGGITPNAAAYIEAVPEEILGGFEKLKLPMSLFLNEHY